MTVPGVTLASFARSLLAHRQLIGRLAAREVTQRFQGSALGLAWVVLTPLLSAAIFTFVFSTVFQTRWPGAVEEGGGWRGGRPRLRSAAPAQLLTTSASSAPVSWVSSSTTGA